MIVISAKENNAWKIMHYNQGACINLVVYRKIKRYERELKRHEYHELIMLENLVVYRKMKRSERELKRHEYHELIMLDWLCSGSE